MSPSTFKRVKTVVHQRRSWNTQSSLGSFSLNLTDVGLFLSALALRYQPGAAFTYSLSIRMGGGRRPSRGGGGTR